MAVVGDLGHDELKRTVLRALALLLVAGLVRAAPTSDPDDDEDKPWAEDALVLPSSSIPARPIRIDLGANTDNVFSVDAETLSVGGDGVVRFLLQVVSPNGATTISFEGIRCDTQELRRYASGRADGQWTRSRSEQWRRIRSMSINSYGSVLMREFFCPGGLGVRTAAEAVSALQRGGHPALRMRP